MTAAHYQISGVVAVLLAAALAASARAESGTSFWSSYTADFGANVSGGLSRGETYRGLFEAGMAVQSPSLFGMPSASVGFSAFGTHGRSLSGRHVGDLQGVNGNDAPRSWRVGQATIEQPFGSVSARIGLFDLNEEFDASETGGLFQHASFGMGPEFGASGANGPSAYPNPGLGMRLAWTASDAFTLRAAVMEGEPQSGASVRKPVFKLSEGEGALLAAEAVTKLGFATMTFGGWRYTAKFDQLDPAAAGPRRGNGGVYTILETKLDRASAYLRAGASSQRFSSVSRFAGAGVTYTGLFGARPDDQVGLGVAAAFTSSGFRRAMRADGLQPRNMEVAIEGTYQAAVTDWLTVQPSLMYIVNPGADRAASNAVVGGLRLSIGFER